MRIHGSNDFAPKADAADKKGRAKNVERASGPRPADEVAKGAKSTESNAPAPADKSAEAVVLSASASRMAEVSSEHSEAIRARLAEVKQMLDAGTYEIDFDALADELMSEETMRSKA